MAKIPKRTSEEKQRAERNLERLRQLLEERVKEDERIAAAKAARAAEPKS